MLHKENKQHAIVFCSTLILNLEEAQAMIICSKCYS